MSQNPYIVVLTTLPADADIAEFAGTLIEERLAACVSAYPEMQSFYRWKNQLEIDAERQIVIKTTTDHLPQLWDRVRALHPYEVPEFIVLSIVDGSEAYLNWLYQSTH